MTYTIERPDHASLLDIEQALEELEQAKRRVKDLEKVVIECTTDLSTIQDRGVRLKIVRYLYWMERRVSAHALTAALLSDWGSRKHAAPITDVSPYKRWGTKLRKMVGPIGYRTCATPDCDKQVPIATRTALDTGSGERYCSDCAECPLKPVPSKNWRYELEDYEADDEVRRQKYREHYEHERSELEQLKQEAQLDEDQLVRLYRLMSFYERQ